MSVAWWDRQVLRCRKCGSAFNPHTCSVQDRAPRPVQQQYACCGHCHTVQGKCSAVEFGYGHPTPCEALGCGGQQKC